MEIHLTKWFGYVPEETVHKLYEDLIRMNRLMGEAKQNSQSKYGSCILI